MSDIENIKKLRQSTGAGFKDCNLIKETINSAKKDSPSMEPIKTKEHNNNKEKTTKTIQEIDREKLDTKFSKSKKNKLN